MTTGIKCTTVNCVLPWQADNTMKLAKNLDIDDTYVLIFSKPQVAGGYLKPLEESPHVNIIFKSKPCVNQIDTYHPNSANTIVVLELKDSYKEYVASGESATV